eukprot:scaffold208501_cov33-Tisochrysis_lutea.AAC.3
MPRALPVATRASPNGQAWRKATTLTIAVVGHSQLGANRGEKTRHVRAWDDEEDVIDTPIRLPRRRLTLRCEAHRHPRSRGIISSAGSIEAVLLCRADGSFALPNTDHCSEDDIVSCEEESLVCRAFVLPKQADCGSDPFGLRRSVGDDFTRHDSRAEKRDGHVVRIDTARHAARGQYHTHTASGRFYG